MNPYADALAAITDAELSLNMHVLATKLLGLVHPDNGYITLSWGDAMALCGVETRRSVWKYLGRLKAAGIIHYSTNERVDVAFEAWRTRHQRTVHAPLADSTRAASGQSESGEKRATVHQRTVHAPLADSTRATGGAPIGLVGRYRSTTSGDLSKPTNQPEPVLDETQNRSRLLLLDPEVGLSDVVASRLAAEHSFEWLLRQVFAWRDDIVAGRVDSAGALVNRIDRNYGPGQLTERDRASPLYQRHVSEDEQRAVEAGKYTPAEYEGIINT